VKSLRQGFVGRQNGPEPSSPDPPDLLGSSGPELWHPEPILRKDLTCSVTNSTKNTSKKKTQPEKYRKKFRKNPIQNPTKQQLPRNLFKKGPLKKLRPQQPSGQQRPELA
jgi:hypothetical protein